MMRELAEHINNEDFLGCGWLWKDLQGFNHSLFAVRFGFMDFWEVCLVFCISIHFLMKLSCEGTAGSVSLHLSMPACQLLSCFVNYMYSGICLLLTRKSNSLLED